MSIHIYDDGLTIGTTASYVTITVPWFANHGTVRLDRDNARELGTDLLQFAETHEDIDYPTLDADGAVKLAIEDNVAHITITENGDEYGAVLDKYDGDGPAIDFAQRLIAWAGPAGVDPVRAAIRDDVWFAVSWAGQHIPEVMHDMLNGAVLLDADGSSYEYHTLAGTCPECGGPVDEMDPAERDLHIIRDGHVLVGCEGYYTPLFVEAFSRYIGMRAVAQG